MWRAAAGRRQGLGSTCGGRQALWWRWGQVIREGQVGRSDDGRGTAGPGMGGFITSRLGSREEWPCKVKYLLDELRAICLYLYILLMGVPISMR